MYDRSSHLHAPITTPASERYGRRPSLGACECPPNAPRRSFCIPRRGCGRRTSRRNLRWRRLSAWACAALWRCASRRRRCRSSSSLRRDASVTRLGIATSDARWSCGAAWFEANAALMDAFFERAPSAQQWKRPSPPERLSTSCTRRAIARARTSLIDLAYCKTLARSPKNKL